VALSSKRDRVRRGEAGRDVVTVSAIVFFCFGHPIMLDNFNIIVLKNFY
jgi:hypothetical protein